MTQLRTGLRRALGVVAVVALLGMPEGIVAEQVQGGVSSMAPGGLLEDGAAPPPGPETRTFGTTSTVAHTIQAFDFRTLAQAQGFTAAGLNGALACATTACSLAAPVFLPAGAVVLFVEGELCDADPANDMTMNFFRVTTPGPTTLPLASATTTGATGCQFLNATLSTPETIDNFTNSYLVEVQSGPNTMTRVVAVRVAYRLQVSPAPGAATFFDVPTSHPFFRFVEALAASGITAGCGGGNFCPDAPLTRGQMAVFLSLGLGLHFVP